MCMLYALFHSPDSDLSTQPLRNKLGLSSRCTTLNLIPKALVPKGRSGGIKQIKRGSIVVDRCIRYPKVSRNHVRLFRNMLTVYHNVTALTCLQIVKNTIQAFNDTFLGALLKTISIKQPPHG